MMKLKQNTAKRGSYLVVSYIDLLDHVFSQCVYSQVKKRQMSRMGTL